MQPFRDLAVGTRSLGEAMINIQYPLDSFLMNASVGKLVLYWRILWAVHEPMHCPRVKPNCPIALYQLNPPVFNRQILSDFMVFGPGFLGLSSGHAPGPGGISQQPKIHGWIGSTV